LTAATIVLEVVGGVALVVGYRLRLFAVLLAGFTLLAGLFFYNFLGLPRFGSLDSRHNRA